jgi:hypothetical protein
LVAVAPASTDEYGSIELFRKDTTVDFEFEGQTFYPGDNQHWKTTIEGLQRLTQMRRIEASGSTLSYVRDPEDLRDLSATFSLGCTEARLAPSDPARFQKVLKLHNVHDFGRALGLEAAGPGIGSSAVRLVTCHDSDAMLSVYTRPRSLFDQSAGAYFDDEGTP